MLILRQLSRSFREGRRQHRILERVDAHIGRGETVAVVGRSGSGKSTLLNVIAGLDRPDSGSIEIDGCDVVRLREPQLTRFRRRHMGFVHQFFNLVPTLDVGENVRLALELNGVRGREARERATAMLAQVDLAGRARSAIDTLSGGEQQRVAVARALVHEPTLILADEPTGNLDDESAARVLGLLLGLVRSRGATLVVVTHDATLAAAVDRVLELHEGRLRERRPGTP